VQLHHAAAHERKVECVVELDPLELLAFARRIQANIGQNFKDRPAELR
jgi:hypothetical protein